MANNISCVYSLTCKDNGKIYYGSTTNFTKRKSQHRHALKTGVHSNRLLQADFKKYGIDNFTFEIVCKIDKRYMHGVEQMFLDMNKGKGYNIAENAKYSGKGRKWSDEHKKLFSVLTKKGWTPEHSASISRSNKARAIENRKKKEQPVSSNA